MAIHRKIPWDDEAHKRSVAKRKLLPENTLYASAADPSARRDMMLLTVMFWVALDTMQHKVLKTHGWELSAEIPDHVHRSFRVMLKNVPEDERKLLSRVLYADADTCLKASLSDTAVGATLAMAHLIVKLTDEGLIADPQSNVVIAALGIMHEAIEEGLQGPWRYLEHEVTSAAEAIWTRAQLAGYLSASIKH